MAEVEHKIRIVAEVETGGTKQELQKLQGQLKDLGSNAEKASQKIGGGPGGGGAGLFAAFKNLKLQIIGVVATLGTASVALGKSLREFAQYDQALRMLTTNLSLIGVRSKLFVSQLEAQANQLERTTRFADDQILSVQSMLVTFGIAPSKIKPATQAIVDFAAATGKDLADAGREVIQTMNGIVPRTSALKFVLQGLSEESLKAGDGLKIIADRFSGAAAKDAESLTGSLIGLTNAFKDLQKTAGQAIAESGFFRGLVANAKKALEVWNDALQGNFGGMNLEPGLPRPSVQKAAQDELARADQAKKDAQAKLELEERRKKNLEEIKKLQDELTKDSQTELENIKLRYIEQMKLIRESAKLGNLTRAEAADAERRALKIMANDRKDTLEKLRDAELDRIKDEYDARKKAEIGWREFFKQPTGDVIQGLESITSGIGSNPVGTIIGGIVGGPAGSAIGAQIESLVKGIIQALPTILGDVLRDVFSIIGNLGKSIFEGIKGGFGLVDLIGDIIDFFDSPDYYSSMSQAIASAMDATQFAKDMSRMANSVGATADAFRSLDQRLARMQGGGLVGRYGARGGGSVDAVLSQIIVAAKDFRGPTGNNETTAKEAIRLGADPFGGGFNYRIADVEKFNEALKTLGESLKAEAEHIVEVANLRIQQLQLIQAEIDRLKGLRSGVADAFSGALSAVSGGLMSPQETSAALRARFESATGEAKGGLGTQLAASLQNEFESAKSLAASGAISGEELQRIQSDLVNQLNATQAEALSEFDRLIEAQNRAADAIVKSGDTVADKIDILKHQAVKQVDALEKILYELKKGNFAALQNVPRYASGTSYVPQTGPAILHQGEAVVPAHMNRGGVTININGVATGGATRDALVQAVRDILNQNLGNVRGAIVKAIR